ncbi:MAG: hypothetical protein IK141_03560, partial [Clostridia bacterium]|nr:hypothetical protein [Clostridia bacterium]
SWPQVWVLDCIIVMNSFYLKKLLRPNRLFPLLGKPKSAWAYHLKQLGYTSKFEVSAFGF